MYNFRSKEGYSVYKLKWSSKREMKVFGKSQKSCFNNILLCIPGLNDCKMWFIPHQPIT